MKKIALIMSLIMVSGIASAVVISFTEYPNGALADNADWNGTGGPWTVDNSGSGTTVATTTSDKAMYNTAYVLSEGDTLSARVDFRFNNTWTASNNTQLAYFHFADTANDTGEAVEANISLRGTASQLQFRYNNNSSGGGTMSMANWQAGDHLAVDYSITLGDSASNSVFALQLFNVTRGESGSILNANPLTSITDTWYTNATTTGVYAGFSTSWQMTNVAPDMNVDTFTVVPEPATIGLVAVFGAGILFIRRNLAV